MFPDFVRCRAEVAADCIANDYRDGNIPTLENPGTEMEIDHTDDGLFHTHDGTIVCMPCYCVLMEYTPSGRGLTPEIPAAIDHVRQLNRNLGNQPTSRDASIAGLNRLGIKF